MRGVLALPRLAELELSIRQALDPAEACNMVRAIDPQNG